MSKKSLLGIDISSTCVRTVRSEGLDAEGNLVISGVSYIPLPDGAVHAGRILSVGAVSAAVKQSVDQLKAKNIPAVLGVTDPDAGTAQLRMGGNIPANKRISFMRTKGVRVLDTVMTSEGDISTYHMSDSVDREGNETSNIMTAIATTSEVDKLRQVADTAGIKVSRIDLTASATTRAVLRDFANSTAVRAVIDIGATTTRVTVVEGLHVREIRTIMSGGNDLTEAISAAAGASIQEAESAKWGMTLVANAPAASYGDTDFEFISSEPASATSKELDALTNAADDLVEQIAQALAMSGGAASLEGLFVVGGTALLRGLLPKLQRRTGLKPLLAAPWVAVKKSKLTEPLFSSFEQGQVNEKILLSFVTACGLATPAERFVK